MPTAHRRRYTDLGARIRVARTDAGLSQERFAAEIQTSRRHVMRLERGDHRPGPTLLSRISEVTGREPKWIDPDADEEDAQMVSDLARALERYIDAKLARVMA